MVRTLVELEAAVSAAERAIRTREVAVRLREQALDTREAEARASIHSAMLAHSQLREANEQLVIANVHSQTLTESAEQEAARMSFAAEHDFLTGLPNRVLLHDRLAQAMAFGQRHGKKVALLYLDLDHFKHINDSLGHAVGDQLLRSVANRLQACVRRTDTVSRQGGDEFVVLLSEVEHVHDAILTARKLIESMGDGHAIDNHLLHVTTSVGISVYPDDGDTIDEMIRSADIAMYQAKASGRNVWRRFTAEMNVRAVARQSVEEALRQALERCEFLLHYQPKVNLETGTITGAEALLRWRRRDGSLVLPAEFVSVAEDCGLIVPIGRWVLREACRQISAWLRSGIEIKQVSVNVSSAEFHSENFFENVRDTLAEMALDPGCLELELTESVLMQDIDIAKSVLHRLKDLGVRIALDDFGTGYSSLSYLHRFPIDTLKIDQSFVRDTGDHRDNAIVGAIIAMGLNLNHRVIAEGVETRAQLAFLRSRHCAEGQGFIFSEPVAPDQLAAIISQGCYGQDGHCTA